MKVKNALVKGILAIVMLVVGMLLVTELKLPERQFDPGKNTITVSAVAADERKEEKTSTTSQLYAHAAVLMDGSNGRILIGKNETEPLPMASTTKIMTCILVLENGNTEDMIPVSAYASAQPKVHLGVKKGEYYKVQDLLYSLMLESHNDTAVILAEYYGSKWNGQNGDCAAHSDEESKRAVEAFARKMNEKAISIGCKNTFFVTPNGLDGTVMVEEEGQRTEKAHATTAADLALLMKYCAWDSPAARQFLEITQTDCYTFSNRVLTEGGKKFGTGSRTFTCSNHNAFLQMMEGMVSGKTGYTGKAGYCYVGALERDQKKYTIALLACGWPSHKSWKWEDSKVLLEYGLENYQIQDIFREEASVPVSVENGQVKEVDVCVKKVPIALLLEKGDRIQIKMKLPEKIAAPVEHGQKIGEQKYYVNGELYTTLPVVAVHEVLRIDYVFCLKKLLKMIVL